MTFLRVLTRDQAANLAAVHTLTALGETDLGAHSCGICVRTGRPERVATVLLAVPGVLQVWAGSTRLTASTVERAA